MRTDLAVPYDWVDNIPNPNSQDYKNVLAWLIQQGAPPPQLSYIRIVTSILPPRPWHQRILGMPVSGDALPLRSGAGAQQPDTGAPGTRRQSPLEPARSGRVHASGTAAAPAPVSTPVPQPGNPVGAPMAQNTRVGCDYYPVAGDTLPLGAVFPSPLVPGQPVYQKIGQATPWGTEIYWQRIA